MVLASVKHFILDVLFPVSCYVCQKEGIWLCSACLGNLKTAEIQICPMCEKTISPRGMLCRKCRQTQLSFLDALITSANYETFPIKQLIYALKYKFVSQNAQCLAKIMARAYLACDAPLPEALVPVPLHPRRLRWRGFNQSLLLAKYISNNLAPPLRIPILDILERSKSRKPQMGIKRYSERIKNVAGIFRLKSDADAKIIQGKSVLLVDDIATTGATLQECARILKSAGAKKVVAAVIARQTLKK